MKNLKVINHLVSWLNKYLKISKMNGFIIGISGGIDSAVTSTILAKTNYPVLAIEISINKKNISQLNRSKQQIKFLKKNFSNVKSNIINISSVFNFLCKKLIYKDDIINELSIINIKPRLRMIVLYYYAANNNYLVVGTGNKVEDFGIGFFTKYGDGGVDINPIGDLKKSEIRSLAKYLEIPKIIQNAEPTDGLWNDNRTDFDQIGLSYDELEWAMDVINNKNYKNIKNYNKKIILNKYLNIRNKNIHKMKTIPICKIPKKLLDINKKI